MKLIQYVFNRQLKMMACTMIYKTKGKQISQHKGILLQTIKMYDFVDVKLVGHTKWDVPILSNFICDKRRGYSESSRTKDYGYIMLNPKNFFFE